MATPVSVQAVMALRRATKKRGWKSAVRWLPGDRVAVQTPKRRYVVDSSELAWSLVDSIDKGDVNPAQWAHGTMSYRQPPGSVRVMTNNPALSRRKARLILHEGMVRGHRLTDKQRRFFGARASGYPMRANPGQYYINARRRRNPYRRNPGKGGTNWLLIGGLAAGAFFLLPKMLGSAGANPLSTLFGGAPAGVPAGYTPIGNGLYRAPNGAVVARNPQTGQMVMAPAGSQPTSAEDLLARAGISMIPSVANNLASWISSMFTTQQTSTGAVVGLPGGTSGGGGSVTSPDVLSGSYLPPIPPLPGGGTWPTGMSQEEYEWTVGSGDGLPPLTELPTYPTYDFGSAFDPGSYEAGGYELPGVPPLNYDVSIDLGTGEYVIANPADWGGGFFGLGHRGGRRRPYMGLRATPPVY